MDDARLCRRLPTRCDAAREDVHRHQASHIFIRDGESFGFRTRQTRRVGPEWARPRIRGRRPGTWERDFDQLGKHVGTVSYMSPDLGSREELDARSDLFSSEWCSTKYAGRQAFSGNTPAVIRSDSQRPIPLRLNRHLPEWTRNHASARKTGECATRNSETADQRLKRDTESGRAITSSAPIAWPRRRTRWRALLHRRCEGRRASAMECRRHHHGIAED
jgi:hypothetical protein